MDRYRGNGGPLFPDRFTLSCRRTLLGASILSGTGVSVISGLLALVALQFDALLLTELCLRPYLLLCVALPFAIWRLPAVK